MAQMTMSTLGVCDFDLITESQLTRTLSFQSNTVLVGSVLLFVEIWIPGCSL